MKINTAASSYRDFVLTPLHIKGESHVCRDMIDDGSFVDFRCWLLDRCISYLIALERSGWCGQRWQILKLISQDFPMLTLSRSVSREQTPVTVFHSCTKALTGPQGLEDWSVWPFCFACLILFLIICLVVKKQIIVFNFSFKAAGSLRFHRQNLACSACSAKLYSKKSFY